MEDRTVWLINQDFEKDLASLAEKLPPGEERNGVWRILRKWRGSVHSATPNMDRVTERLQAFTDECDERNRQRTLTVQITDPEGAQVSITGTGEVVMDYLNIVIDGLDNLDGCRAKLNALGKDAA